MCYVERQKKRTAKVLLFSANPVSRVLSRSRSCALYHLSTIAVTRNLQRPTPRHRTSNPHLSVYTALQPVRRTAEAYRYLRGGLLPRLFTLTRRMCGRRSFSVTLLHPHGRQAVNLDGALCCSDFPPFASVVFGCAVAALRGNALEASREAVATPLLTGEQR